MQSPSQYTCPRCNAPIQAGQRVCTQCGLALDPQSIAAYQQQSASQQPGPVQVGPTYAVPTPPRKRPAWLIPVIVVAVGLCAICGIIGALTRGPAVTNVVQATSTGAVAALAPTSTGVVAHPTDTVAELPASTVAAEAPTDTAVPPVATATSVAATATPPAPTEVPAAGAGKVGQPQTAGGISLTVNKVSTTSSINDFLKPKAGNFYLVVDVTIQNLDRDSAPYNPLYFKVKDADGFEYNMSVVAPDPGLKSGALAKGDKVRGNVAFEVPKTANGFVLSYEPLVVLGGYTPIQVNLGR